MNEPQVSVLIPAYNAARYVGDAIQSALTQTAPPLEVVVVDDGSDDDTRAMVDSFGEPVRCETQPHAGIGHARNRCVELARGDHLAFLDADDLWEPHKLELQLAAVRSKSPDIVFGYVRQFVSPELPPERASRIVCPSGVQPGYVAGAMLAPRALFTAVGPFATNLHVGEFVDWMARARDLGVRELMLEELVLHRRLHDANQGATHRDRVGDFAHVLKAALDRRRMGSSR